MRALEGELTILTKQFLQSQQISKQYFSIYIYNYI